MELIQLAVLISALLCSLVTGIVLCFAIIVMPGIKTLGTLDFLKSFKAMDRIIQNNHPLFISVWLGSAFTLFTSVILGIWLLEGFDLGLLKLACTIYLLGVHLPTSTINIPLNNQLQSLDLDTTEHAELQVIAELFASQWLRWNTIRTVFATLTTIILLVLLSIL